MGYWNDERSLTSSQPIELHSFVTDAQEWLYADSPVGIMYGGKTYSRAVIHGDRIEVGSNAARNRSYVRTTWKLPFAAQYIECPPDGVVAYTRIHLQGAEGHILFYGTVTDVEFEQASRHGDREAKIILDPYTGDTAVSGLVLRFERTCGIALYSDGCGVDRDNFKVEGVLTAASGLNMTADEFDAEEDGWFTGGLIVVNGRRRKIAAHADDVIRVVCRIPGLQAGQSFVAYAGCDRLYETCRDKFSNEDNFKGCPFIPDKSPFGEHGVL